MVATSQLFVFVVVRFGVFGYKHYVMLFLGSCFMPYKRHKDIVDVACYIKHLFGNKDKPQLWVRV